MQTRQPQQRPTIPVRLVPQQGVPATPEQWMSSSAGRTTAPEPIPLSFSVPGNYSATTTGGPILLDPYTVQFNMSPSLVIPDGCLCNLIQASFAYTQPNIAGAGILAAVPNGNNRVTIKWGTLGANQDIIIPTGLYSYLDVQQVLNVYMYTHDASGATVPSGSGMVTGSDLWYLVGIPATQELVVTLNPAGASGATFPAGGMTVSFVNPSPTTGLNDSVGLVLGYPVTGGGASFTTPATTALYVSYAPNTSNFAATSAYALYVSFLKSSYQNGLIGQLLYVFPLGNSNPNSVVSHYAPLRSPIPVSSGTYSNITMYTTDQSGNKLPWAYYQAPFQFSALIAKNRPDGSL